ncbi:hypothetical protein EfsSVR2331_20260 [Enterococcus faecalis]|nr:hypothetical protein EfsSVR2331_20260 [Enterococcus faecalis]
MSSKEPNKKLVTVLTEEDKILNAESAGSEKRAQNSVHHFCSLSHCFENHSVIEPQFFITAITPAIIPVTAISAKVTGPPNIPTKAVNAPATPAKIPTIVPTPKKPL